MSSTKDRAGSNHSSDLYRIDATKAARAASASAEVLLSTDGNKQRKYYLAYEDRYQRVYEQGVPFWSAFPCELEEDFEGLEELLKSYYERGSTPGTLPAAVTEYPRVATKERLHVSTEERPRVLEPGCGEAPLALKLVSLGFDYVGVDLAASALLKAKERLEEAEERPELFLATGPQWAKHS